MTTVYLRKQNWRLNKVKNTYDFGKPSKLLNGKQVGKTTLDWQPGDEPTGFREWHWFVTSAMYTQKNFRNACYQVGFCTGFISTGVIQVLKMIRCIA